MQNQKNKSFAAEGSVDTLSGAPQLPETDIHRLSSDRSIFWEGEIKANYIVLREFIQLHNVGIAEQSRKIVYYLIDSSNIHFYNSIDKVIVVIKRKK